jgi:hypothetical protein
MVVAASGAQAQQQPTPPTCMDGKVWTGTRCETPGSGDDWDCGYGGFWNGTECTVPFPPQAQQTTPAQCPAGQVWSGVACFAPLPSPPCPDHMVRSPDGCIYLPGDAPATDPDPCSQRCQVICDPGPCGWSGYKRIPETVARRQANRVLLDAYRGWRAAEHKRLSCREVTGWAYDRGSWACKAWWSAIGQRRARLVSVFTLDGATYGHSLRRISPTSPDWPKRRPLTSVVRG